MDAVALVLLAALLSGLHVLALGLGLGAVFLRGLALASTLDDDGWRRVLAADNAWAAAAGLWIATGLLRVFYGGKDPDFYWSNGFFWIKLAVFGAVFALELAPMRAFIRVRAARRRGGPLPLVTVERFRRTNAIQLILVVAIVFLATLMTRGVWLW